MSTTYPPSLAAMIDAIRKSIENDDYLKRSYQKELLRYVGQPADAVMTDIDDMFENLMIQARERWSGPELDGVERIYLARALMTFDDVTALTATGGSA